MPKGTDNSMVGRKVRITVGNPGLTPDAVAQLLEGNPRSGVWQDYGREGEVVSFHIDHDREPVVGVMMVDGSIKKFFLTHVQVVL